MCNLSKRRWKSRFFQISITRTETALLKMEKWGKRLRFKVSKQLIWSQWNTDGSVQTKSQSKCNLTGWRPNVLPDVENQFPLDRCWLRFCIVHIVIVLYFLPESTSPIKTLTLRTVTFTCWATEKCLCKVLTGFKARFWGKIWATIQVIQEALCEVFLSDLWWVHEFSQIHLV